MRARVLYMAHAFNIGGAEEMTLTLARGLPPRFAPRVCCIHSAGPLGAEFRSSGVAFEVLGLTPGLRRPQDVSRLRAYLAKTRPHIVHTFLLTASLYGRFAAMLARVPIIVGTEVNVYAQKQRAHVMAERLLMRGTDCVIASAKSVRDAYVDQISADPGRVKVIYNAVDWSALDVSVPREAFRRELGIPAAVHLITVIARLTEQKAHRVLFDALAETPALRNAHVLVVGDGELRGDLARRTAALAIQPRVHFAGARRDLGNVLEASDAFVMPSRWEGLPLSLVLAMGAGLPVVATRVAGIPEVVEHEATGLLVEPGDPGALGSALGSLIDSPSRRAALGSAARAFVVPRFGAERYVSQISGVYDSLLAAKGLP